MNISSIFSARNVTLVVFILVVLVLGTVFNTRVGPEGYTPTPSSNKRKINNPSINTPSINIHSFNKSKLQHTPTPTSTTTSTTTPTTTPTTTE